MKKLLMGLIIAGLVSCGVETNKVTDSEALAGTGLSCIMNERFVGSWVNDNIGEVLTITDNCAIATDLCHVLGAATAAESPAGMLTLVIRASDGGACLPEGTYACGYFLELSDTKLRLTCDGKSYYYTRK